MNHFGLSRSRNCDRNNMAVSPKTLAVSDNSKKDAPALFEGWDALESVCPVSSLTGNRMSIYEAMQMVGNEKYSRAIDALLPEIPAIMSDARLSDDDRVDMMVSRLSTGSTSEDTRLREQLSQIVSDFKDSVELQKSAPVESVSVDSTSSADE